MGTLKVKVYKPKKDNIEKLKEFSKQFKTKTK
jgi:hypothetical protein